MATTLTKDPHDNKGELLHDTVKASTDFAVNQFESGKEVLLGISRVDLKDGTHLTMIHHKAK
jgi:hypothetical protein